MSDATPPVDTTTLVESNLPLVGYNVNELMRRLPASVDRDDLASAGALALVMAARSYDPSTNVPFARYASRRIKGALLDELRSRDWASRGTRRRARQLAAATEQLQTALGRTPTREELAETLGTDASTIDEIRADAERRVLSLDLPDHNIADTLASDSATPEGEALASERMHWLRAAVQELPERLRVVISGLYLEGLSGVEVAERLGITQSRVSQLRTAGLAMLRDGLNAAFDPDLVQARESEGVVQRRREAYFAAIAARAGAAASVRLDTVPTQRATRTPVAA